MTPATRIAHLTPEGDFTWIYVDDDADITDVIKTEFGTDLVERDSIPNTDVDIWRDARAQIRANPMNIPAMMLMDSLSVPKCDPLPRTCGNIIVTMHSPADPATPVGVTPRLDEALREMLTNYIHRKAATRS